MLHPIDALRICRNKRPVSNGCSALGRFACFVVKQAFGHGGHDDGCQNQAATDDDV